MKHYLIRFWPIYFLIICCVLVCTLGGNHTVVTIAENAPIARKHVIVIDAGHGGEDGGAISCTGYFESNINLEIALRLNDLCHLLGLDTIMIRTTDVSVYTEGSTLAAKKASDLRQRVSLINAQKNAVLVSIHQNTFSDSRYYGAQVFYANTAGSRELAEQLQNTIHDTGNRKAKEASGVYLMRHIQTTGILVECGFLSNPQEEMKLRTAEYQKQLCGIIATVLSVHINA